MFLVQEKKCPVCKKIFAQTWPEMWAYKSGGEGHRKYYCSYHCLRAAERKEEERRKAR